MSSSRLGDLLLDDLARSTLQRLTGLGLALPALEAQLDAHDQAIPFEEVARTSLVVDGASLRSHSAETMMVA